MSILFNESLQFVLQFVSYTTGFKLSSCKKVCGGGGSGGVGGECLRGF